MKKILMYVWQLPQHLLALLLLFIIRSRKMVVVHDVDGTLLYLAMGLGWGISLGKYILLDMDASEETMNHERGHCRQSRVLGWLYLIIVGIPSIVMNVLSAIMYWLGSDSMIRHYYQRWPESWADRLGGVKRIHQEDDKA